MPDHPGETHAAADRLHSWKEIAAYLKRGVSTAQRWSRTEGLPVHRLPHGKAGSVFAYRSEIDAWWRERSVRLEAETEPEDGADASTSDPATQGAQAAGTTSRRVTIALTMVLSMVAAAGVFSYWLGLAGRAFDSVAVLPFATDADQHSYLSDGITEHLINTLSEISSLRVTARPHAFRYAGPQVDLQQAGQELGVGAIITGRVSQRDGVVDVQVDLIDVNRGSQLWGRRYSETFVNILALQQRIGDDVSARLGVPTGTTRTALARRSTTNIDAYEAFLKARYYWNRRTEESIRRAVEHFEQALEIDPQYALAAAGLADCYAVYSIYQLEPPRASGPRAILAATRALQLDETMAEPHAALGFVKAHYEWDWPGADTAFRRSLELDPNYANAHFWQAVYLSAIGQTDLAIAAARRAQQLDPLSLVIRAGVGGEPGLYAARRYDEAIEQVQGAIDLDPGFAVGYLWQSLSLLQKRLHVEAISALEKARDLSGNSPLVLGPLGHAYAVAGQPLRARGVLAELAALSKHRYVSPFDHVLVHLGLEDDNQAFAWLEKAFVDRSYRMHWLKVDPRFDRLRGDERFTTLLERMGLNGPRTR